MDNILSRINLIIGIKDFPWKKETKKYTVDFFFHGKTISFCSESWYFFSAEFKIFSFRMMDITIDGETFQPFKQHEQQQQQVNRLDHPNDGFKIDEKSVGG